MKSRHVRKTFPPAWPVLWSHFAVPLSVFRPRLRTALTLFIQSPSAKIFHSTTLKSFWLSSWIVMEYFLVFPSDENADPLNMKQIRLMLKQRSFLKVNCLINSQIVPSTHYKSAICLIYAQSGKSCKYNAKSRRLELLLLLFFSLCNCLQ